MYNNIRGDTLIYSNKGFIRADKLNTTDIIMTENGFKKITEITKTQLNNKMVYKIKNSNNIDIFFINKNTKILSVQNIPNDLKYNEIISYMENNDKGVSKICFNEIKNLSDFDYIALPILSFDDENKNEYENDYYRFRGILYLIDNIEFNYEILLNDNKNINTISFLNKYLYNNEIKYDSENIKGNIKINFYYENNDDLNINISKEKTISLLKGLLECFYVKNNEDFYINLKIKDKYKVYFIKNVLYKFQILPNIFYNKNEDYYIVKIPKIGIINEIFNNNLNFDINNLNYFTYDKYIFTKIKSISKIDKYTGYMYNIYTNDNNFLSECGIIS
jgi:hypothetical protein